MREEEEGGGGGSEEGSHVQSGWTQWKTVAVLAFVSFYELLFILDDPRRK